MRVSGLGLDVCNADCSEWLAKGGSQGWFVISIFGLNKWNVTALIIETMLESFLQLICSAPTTDSPDREWQQYLIVFEKSYLVESHITHLSRGGLPISGDF